MSPDPHNMFIKFDDELQATFDDLFDGYLDRFGGGAGTVDAFARAIGFANHSRVSQMRAHQVERIRVRTLQALLRLCVEDRSKLRALTDLEVRAAARVLRARLRAVADAPDDPEFKRAAQRQNVARLFPHAPNASHGGRWIRKVAKLAEVKYSLTGQWHTFVQVGPDPDDVLTEIVVGEQNGNEGTLKHNPEGKEGARRWAIDFAVMGSNIVGYYLGSEDEDEDREVVLVGKLLGSGRLLVGQLADSEGTSRRIVLARDKKEGRKAYATPVAAVA